MQPGWTLVAVGVSAAGVVLVAVGMWLRVRSREGGRGAVASGIAADAGIALTTGAVVGLVLFAATGSLEQGLLDAQEHFEEDRFRREARRDNIRFVREVATQASPSSKPFAGLDLREAQLAGLDLSGAVLTDADLTGADLHDTALVDADLTGAKMSRVNLEGADLARATLSNVDLSSSNLTEAYLAGADLTRADMSHVELSSLNMADAVLERTNLSGANVSRSSLARAQMFLTNLSDASVINSNLLDATMSEVDLEGTRIFGSELSGVNFAFTDPSVADLDCVIYSDATRWPTGFTPPPPFDEQSHCIGMDRGLPPADYRYDGD